MSTPTAPPEAPASAPEAPAPETEAPAQLPLEGEPESAAPEPEPAAELQVSAVEPGKPEYMTRADWEREKAEVAARAAADALESDRRRRQTENARRAAAEQRAAEERAEARDTVRAAFGAAGIFEIPDESVYTAIDRVATKKAQSLVAQQADATEQGFDYVVAPITGQQIELDDSFEAAARKLAPKVQNLLDTARPIIESAAIDNYKKSDGFKKDVDAEIARRNAAARKETTELQRPEGQAPSSDMLVWWKGLGPEGRKDPANQARFDAYTSRL